MATKTMPNKSKKQCLERTYKAMTATALVKLEPGAAAYCSNPQAQAKAQAKMQMLSQQAILTTLQAACRTLQQMGPKKNFAHAKEQAALPDLDPSRYEHFKDEVFDILQR